MIVMPAIDLRDGACVQLVGGSYDDERVRLKDPAAVALAWRTMGFHHLHVVDLDAATGRGANDKIVSRLVGGDCAVQVGGGIRSTERIDALLSRGANRVVLGTRALEDRAWLESAASRWPGRIVVAVDVRGRAPVLRGWTEQLPETLDEVICSLLELPLAGVLVTAVDVEGRLRGPDLSLVDDVLARLSLPLFASGGITTLDDLNALRDRGVSAAVVGMALYTGAMNATRVAEEFGR